MCPAISSRKLGSSLEGQLKNAYLYNGKELFEDADLNWYDYGFRNYDPQIGRFPQLDPLAFEYAFYTPYQYAGCEPISNVDVDGLEPASAVGVAVDVTTEVGKQTLEAGAKVLEGAVVRAVVKSAAKETVKKGGFWRGVGRFFKGAWDGITETAEAIVNVFNPDPDKNTLWQTGKFLVKAVTDPVGTFNDVKQAIKQIDWSDPATYGKIFTSTMSPGGTVKAVKYFSKTVVGSKRTSKLLTKLEDAATTESQYTNGGLTGKERVLKSAANEGLSINTNVLENFTKHAFAGGRHSDLGLAVKTMASKGLSLIEDYKSLLKAGDNTLIGNINGIQKTFKAFVQDGKIMSVNMYPGISNRVTQGTVINFGSIIW